MWQWAGSLKYKLDRRGGHKGTTIARHEATCSPSTAQTAGEGELSKLRWPVSRVAEVGQTRKICVTLAKGRIIQLSTLVCRKWEPAWS